MILGEIHSRITYHLILTGITGPNKAFNCIIFPWLYYSYVTLMYSKNAILFQFIYIYIYGNWLHIYKGYIYFLKYAYSGKK